MANISQYHKVTLSSRLRVFLEWAGRYRNAFLQLFRFGVVGVSNVTIDLLALNILLLRFPTRSPMLLLLYNTLAYALGALNSFILNKYWTFKQTRSMTASEIVRFTLVNVAGIFCNDAFVWLAARALHPLINNTFIWANTSKLSAVAGTALITYFGMRLWVFRSQKRNVPTRRGAMIHHALASVPISDEGVMNRAPTKVTPGKSEEHMSQQDVQVNSVASLVGATSQLKENTLLTQKSLSVVLPAYNEEEIIGTTIERVIATLEPWLVDFELVVVNDGSYDETQAVIASIAGRDARVRFINHERNQGYGAALVSGFAAVSKDLTFFMDSDGQFEIGDLAAFFPLIERYDAVLGYRIDRQDTWIRKLNAWAWKMLITCMFGINVRDIDCAFKLFHSAFFHENLLETRGAMINVEMLYKLKRAGYRYEQLGVHHLPRTSGRATGAKLSVILRAFRELFTYASKWHNEERQKNMVKLTEEM